MRIYYEDAQVCVSSAGLRTHGRRYRLGDVEHAWRAGRPEVGRRAAAAASMALGAVLAQLLFALVGRWVLTGGHVHLTMAVLIVCTAARVLAGATVLDAVEDVRRYGHRLELWARIAGMPVLLLSTDDAIRYGQICRALVRALDNRHHVRRTGPVRRRTLCPAGAALRR